MDCVRCDKPIEDMRGAWAEVRAYARPKIQRGKSGSSLIARKNTGNFLCGGCAVEIQHGPRHLNLF